MLRLWLLAWVLCGLVGYAAAPETPTSVAAKKIIAAVGIILGIVALFVAVGPFYGAV